MYNQFVKKYAHDIQVSLTDLIEKGCKSIQHFDINCSILKDYNYTPIQTSEEYLDLFEKLIQMRGPVLYIFEITSTFSKDGIIEAITAFSKSERTKNTPAIKSQIPDSNILYIGKVEKDFWGRIVTHFGYNKSNGTQGLQLFHWAPPLGLQLKLTAIEFQQSATSVIGILEKNLAKDLQPILGKH